MNQEEEGQEEDGNSTPPRTKSGAEKKKRLNIKKFKRTWLNLPEFAGWLKPVLGDDTKCKCIACNCHLTCGLSELKKHGETTKHRNNVKSLQNIPKITTVLKDDGEEKRIQNLVQRTKVAEIKIAAMFAEHNMALMVVDHMIPVLKEIFPDSQTCQRMSLGRTKCTQIIQNIVAKVETDETIEMLKQVKFSILVDESTDIATYKNLCVLVRYLSSVDGKVRTELLELVHLDARNGSAEHLYECFKACLNSKQIPLSNIVGLASDGCNVMVGEFNSFYSRLRAEVPSLILIKCICHSAALVASHACKKLPRRPEELMRQIYGYVSGSSKRCDQLTEIQAFMAIAQTKILKLSVTRWLCMHQCVERILSNWEALKQYFIVAAVEDRLETAVKILESLNDLCVKAYFLFLKYALNYFNSFNALFQSREILIHSLSQKSKQLYRQVCQNFVKPEFLRGAVVLDFKPIHYLEIEHVYLGPECEILVTTFPSEVVTSLRLKVLEFYAEAAGEMAKRLPLNNKLMDEMSFIQPSIALSSERESHLNLPLLTFQFSGSGIDKTLVALEWRNLPFAFSDEEKKRLSSLPIDEMWESLAGAKSFGGELSFSNVSKLAKLVLSLPHSNAEAERIFSMVNDIKTRKRNRLGESTLNAMTVVRSKFQAKNVNCCSFKVNNIHLGLHTSANLYCAEESVDASEIEHGL